jgi:endoglucanase
VIGVRVVSGVLAGTMMMAAAAVAAPAAAAPRGLIRVDQTGFAPAEGKQAYLMTTAAIRRARFSVVDAHGHTVLSGRVGQTSRGKWNAAYPTVYPIDLSALRRPGTYRITVAGDTTATSPTFRVRPAADLYGELVRAGVTFFQAQRDGRHVVRDVMNRRPAHLNDRAAAVYATPTFVTDDVIADADLTRIGGPVDVEGGWSDAGDYLKFTHSTAYGAITLLASARALGRAAPSTLDREARHGIQWLDKMWDRRTGTLHIQVGVGSGNEAGTFGGDHDMWRLPEADDGNPEEFLRYAAAHRPVFDAGPAGAPISPNLAGRVSAAFALAAQVDARHQPARARRQLREAIALDRRAAVAHPPAELVTALPHAFYPEDTWHDDMELGAVEIALAARTLGVRGADRYLRDAIGFARGYLAAETGDTFNLYDVSALAHADLVAALGRRDRATKASLVADLRRQVRTGATRAAADVFHAGAVYTDFDADAHTGGLIATEALYRTASGDTSYAAFATRQRDWLFGANAWGVSFMVGVGTTYPRCPQHQLANLVGRPLVGAVVNGPNDPALFEDGLGDYQDAMVPCPAGGTDPYAVFSRADTRFVEDVRAWQTDEPALDMTGSAIVGAALQAAASRHR